MTFDERRGRCRQSRLIGQRNVGGIPARAGTYAVGMFEGRKELVSQEGVSISTQGIPLPWVELVNAVMDARSGLCRAQECFSTSKASR